MAIGGKVFDMHLHDIPFSFRVDLIIANPSYKMIQPEILPKVLLDTGATDTFLPLSVIKNLKLRDAHCPIVISGYDNRNEEEFRTYTAKIILEGVDEFIIRVGGWDNAPVIGRDILKRWHILLNTPHTTFEIVKDINYKLGG